jgi:pimeloyl-ACP methyl ester carboxylesterase
MSYPTLLVPGLLCTAQLYAAQIPVLWQHGAVMAVDPVHDDSIAAMATRVLENAPPTFNLAGLSMGGYVAMEIMRQAPHRVHRLALLDTTARPDTPQAGEMRRGLMALSQQGQFEQVPEQTYPNAVHPSRCNDAHLKAINHRMAMDVGVAAYLRQQTAIMARIDSRPSLSAITCPTLVCVGDSDKITPPEVAEEIAAAIPHASLVVIPESGHLSTIEQPNAVNKALATWLS